MWCLFIRELFDFYLRGREVVFDHDFILRKICCSISIIKDMERLSNITIYLYSLKPLLYIGIEIHTN
jgi:hypothetical protein